MQQKQEKKIKRNIRNKEKQQPNPRNKTTDITTINQQKQGHTSQ